MSFGEGIAFAALMWAIVQISYLLHQRSRACTVDEVKDKLDKIQLSLEDCLGISIDSYSPPIKPDDIIQKG